MSDLLRIWWRTESTVVGPYEPDFTRSPPLILFSLLPTAWDKRTPPPYATRSPPFLIPSPAQTNSVPIRKQRP